MLALAEEKGSVTWKASGMLRRASLLALTGKTSDAVSIFTSAIPVWRSTGAKLFFPVWLSHFARACAELGEFNEAWSYIAEAMTAVETTKQNWNEAEVHRIAGEIALMSPEPDMAKAEAYFERALAVRVNSRQIVGAARGHRAWRGYGAIKGSGTRPENFWLRSTAGSPRALTRWT